MKSFNIGIIGLGTVGGGVYKLLADFPQIKIKKIAVNNINKRRNIENLDKSLLTDNPYDIADDPEIDIIIETAGGVYPIFDVLKKAVKNKKHIVTANKELLAKRGSELFKLAKETGSIILYEAAAAAAIPVIMPVKTILCANKINKIAGILNGTTNYILTQMTEKGISYDTALKEAQELGYAETNPAGDVEGYDAAYKLALLSTICFNKKTDINKIYTEGITKIRAQDIKSAEDLGYAVKLIALGQRLKDGRIDARVHPMLVAKKHLLAKVNNALNSIMLSCEPAGDLVFTGAGAGALPTAGSVIGDLMVLAANLENTEKGCAMPQFVCNHTETAEQAPVGETFNEYYISVSAGNHPGAIGFIGTILGKHSINIASIMQRGINSDNTAEIVVITETAKEDDVQNALSEMLKSDIVKNIGSLLRVMN